jgi:hypothetical protein
MQDQTSKVIEETKKLVDDGFFEIGARKYTINKVPFRKARKIYTYFSSIQEQIQKSNFEFMESDRFLEVEGLICKYIDYNSSSLFAIGIEKHFEKYPSDYDKFIITSLMVFSFPFIQGLNGE